MACKRKEIGIIDQFYLFFAYNSCGTTPEHCGNIDPTAGQGNCRQTGCAPGLCCSRFGLYVEIYLRI
jgi:hypothetical protein